MRKYLTILLFILVLTSPALALDVPPQPQGYVNDYANLLSSDTRYKLERALEQYEAQTSNQLVIATFASLEGESLEDFSIRLAEAWQVGTKENDNGLILLVFRDDRKMRIEVGYGLEDVVTDATASLIINNEIAPYFKEGDYDRGIIAGISAVIQAIGGKYEGAGRSPYQPKRSALAQSLLIVLFLMFPIFFRLFLFGALFRGFGYGHRGTYGGYGGFGGGGFGGGGFGGFGGGGFGGGGASGGW